MDTAPPRGVRKAVCWAESQLGASGAGRGGGHSGGHSGGRAHGALPSLRGPVLAERGQPVSGRPKRLTRHFAPIVDLSSHLYVVILPLKCAGRRAGGAGLDRWRSRTTASLACARPHPCTVCCVAAEVELWKKITAVGTVFVSGVFLNWLASCVARRSCVLTIP